MNSSINIENIREYLLGRVANDSLLSEIEELLFLDTDFFDAVELEQEGLVHDYVFGRLSETDRNDFEKTLSANKQRKLEVELAFGLKEKAKQAIPAEPIKKQGFLESIKASFKRPAFGGDVAVLQPAYVGAFAVLLIAIIGLSVLLIPRKNMDDLAELRSIYSQKRQTQARISGFDYAPFEPVRGTDTSEGDKRKLGQIRDKLVGDTQTDPSAKTYHALGVFYLHEGKFDQAVEEFNLAIKTGPDSAELHNDLGSAYFEMGKSNADGKAFENLTRAVDEFKLALQLDPNKLEALFNLSFALQKSDRENQAAESWKQYLEKDPSSKWADEARKNLELLSKSRGGLKTSEQVLEDFLAAWQSGNDEMAWKINSQTRNVLSGVWLPAQLSRRYIEAKLDRDPKKERDNIDALTYIGTLEKARNADFFISDLALSLARTGSGGTEKIRDAHKFFDEGLLSIGSKDKRALESFEASARSFSEAGNEQGEILARYWAMQCLSSLGRLREGLQMGSDIIDFSRAKNYKWLEASARYFSGIVLFKQEEFTRALDSYTIGLEGSKGAGDTLLEQRIVNTIIETCMETGEIRKALRYHYRNDDLYYRDPVTQWRNNLSDGRILLKLKLDGAAAEFAAESLAYARKTGKPDTVASSLLLMAESMAAKNRLDEALSLAEQALAVVDADDKEKPARKGNIVLNIANLKSELGKNEESLADYDQAISLFEKVPEIQLDNYAAHRGRLMRFRDLHRSADVTAELETVLSLADGFRRKVYDDESRQTFFDNEQAVFEIAVEDSLSRGENIEAFQRAERSRARSLLDMIGQKKSIDDLLKTVGVAEPLSADEIRAKMPADSQIVEYALLEERLIAWVVSKEGVQTVDLKIDTKTLETNITELARMDRNRNSPVSGRNPIAAELYRTLIAPLSKYLDPAKTLVIVPDKSLYYVPFAALVTEENKFLIERFTVSYAPSSTIFVSTSNDGPVGGDRKAARLLSVGDPDFDRTQFTGLAELDAAKDEVREIAEMMPGRKPLTGIEATKETFMSALVNAEIVHFAGHYVSDPEVPSRSKLVFAGKDGGLRMSEITKKKLPDLQLVVLSACETGIDNVMRGEGAISASRAFLAAGARVVVASQWKVDSGASAKLMVAFHRNRQQGLNSAAALKSAQIEMINNPAGPFASPYYWAAFGVTGGLEN